VRSEAASSATRPIVRGSKQTWLTMYVASGALSNMAWIVVSSLITG
jgi:hypothetical protein